jgi:hypothetical protein
MRRGRRSTRPTCTRAWPSSYRTSSSSSPLSSSRYTGPGASFFPDPNFFHSGSKFFPSRILIKEFKYFNPKICFSSSRKYDPGCSSRILILIFYPYRIPDLGIKRAPDPDPQHCPEPLSQKLTRSGFRFSLDFRS